LLKTVAFVLVMFVASTVLTGCDPAQIGQIGDQVIKIVTDTIQTIRGAGGTGGAAAPAPAPADTAAAPTDTTAAPAPAPADTAAAPAAPDAGQCTITIYSTPTCKYCKQAKEYFEAKGYPVVYTDITKDPAARKTMETQAAAQGVNITGVPVIDICGTMLNGFQPAEIDRVLKEKADAVGTTKQMTTSPAAVGATTGGQEDLNPGN